VFDFYSIAFVAAIPGVETRCCFDHCSSRNVSVSSQRITGQRFFRSSILVAVYTKDFNVLELFLAFVIALKAEEHSL